VSPRHRSKALAVLLRNHPPIHPVSSSSRLNANKPDLILLRSVPELFSLVGQLTFSSTLHPELFQRLYTRPPYHLSRFHISLNCWPTIYSQNDSNMLETLPNCLYALSSHFVMIRDSENLSSVAKYQQQIRSPFPFSLQSHFPRPRTIPPKRG